MSVRVRFAPSPTGALHIGGVRTALYNYLLAKKWGGTFVLRVEDTDQNRFVPGAEEYIIETLKWCGIEPTEGIGFGDGQYAPYRQSERKDVYRAYAMQLIESGHAYYAFDTPTEIEDMRERLKNESNQSYSMVTRETMKNSLSLSEQEVTEWMDNGVPYVIRLKVPDNQIVMIDDLIRGEVSFNTNELDDKVLLKADGMPTYHLANIVDDYLMKITHVIRGEEWLPSAGHHVLIYKAFGWEASMPRFAHLPLILKPDGKGKLSKRDGKKFGFPVFPLSWKGNSEEDSFVGFREMGFDPRAVINFLALLGWNSGTEQEIFSLDELCDKFSLEKINKSGARFDYDKAKWFNQQYIMHTPNADLAEQLYPLSIEQGFNVSKEYLAQFAGLMKERVTFFNEFLEKGYYFFKNVESFDDDNIKKRWKPENRAKFENLKTVFSTLDFNHFEGEATPAHTLENAVKEWINANALKMGEVLPLLRIALAGTMQGPAVFDMAILLGKEEVSKRLSIAFDYFDKICAH
jgi:glutamyl-tRNA synthetase